MGHNSSYSKDGTLLEIVKKRRVRLFGSMVIMKWTVANAILLVKVEGKDHVESQQDSGWTM